MARNVNETEADEATQGGNIMERDDFLDVLAKLRARKAKIAKETGEVSALLNRAENDKNLDKKAMAIMHWARNQEPSRLNTFLQHFDAYRQHADLDAMAGSDMFDGATAGPAKAAGKASGNGATKVAAPAKPPKAARKPKAGPKPGKAGGRKKKGEGESVSAAEAAASIWGLNKETETAGAA